MKFFKFMIAWMLVFSMIAGYVVIALPQNVIADTHEWVSDYNSYANIPENWNSGEIPSNGDIVKYNVGSSDCHWNYDISLTKLEIGNYTGRIIPESTISFNMAYNSIINNEHSNYDLRDNDLSYWDPLILWSEPNNNGFPSPQYDENHQFIWKIDQIKSWANVDSLRYKIPSEYDSFSIFNGTYYPMLDNVSRIGLMEKIYFNGETDPKSIWLWSNSTKNTNNGYNFDTSNVSGFITVKDLPINKINKGDSYQIVMDIAIHLVNGTTIYRHTDIQIYTELQVTGSSSWITSVIWIMIIFFPIWILNYALPKYGFIIGTVIMAVAISMYDNDFFYVGLIMALTVGLIAFNLTREG